jgi:hypothetical protein
MGPEKRIHRALRTIRAEELRAKFPKLVAGIYQRASVATARYNCVAFANGDERHWWNPQPQLLKPKRRYYWPPDIKKEWTLETLIEIFTSTGYEIIKNQEIEPGWEKVAIYVSLEDMEPSHVAKSDGRVWKSKLGKGQDIEHYSLDVLEGDTVDEYGIVECVLGRRLSESQADTLSD